MSIAAKQVSLPSSGQLPLETEVEMTMMTVAASPTGGGLHAQLQAARTVLEARSSEVTLTWALTLKSRAKVAIVNAIVGLKYDPSLNDYRVTQDVLHPDGYELRSTLKQCAECDGNKCGRKGKFHDVWYGTDVIPVNAIVAKQRQRDGLPDRKWAVLPVDPETGIAKKRLPGLEAVKLLREHGKHVTEQKWIYAKSGTIRNDYVEEPAFGYRAREAQQNEPSPVLPA